MAAVVPAAVAADPLGSRSSGRAAAAGSIRAEAESIRAEAESPSVGHPSLESRAAAAGEECCPSEEVLLKAAAECCPSEAVLLKAAAGSPSSRARP